MEWKQPNATGILAPSFISTDASRFIKYLFDAFVTIEVLIIAINGLMLKLQRKCGYSVGWCRCLFHTYTGKGLLDQ